MDRHRPQVLTPSSQRFQIPLGATFSPGWPQAQPPSQNWQNLKVLETAGLISRDRDAQRRLSRLEAKPLFEAAAWLEDFRRSTKPAAYVEDSVAGSKEKKKKKDKKTKHKKH
jgi:hypothetical protein